jgi:hypothetical protein
MSLKKTHMEECSDLHCIQECPRRLQFFELSRTGLGIGGCCSGRIIGHELIGNELFIIGLIGDVDKLETWWMLLGDEGGEAVQDLAHAFHDGTILVDLLLHSVLDVFKPVGQCTENWSSAIARGCILIGATGRRRWWRWCRNVRKFGFLLLTMHKARFAEHLPLQIPVVSTHLDDLAVRCLLATILAPANTRLVVGFTAWTLALPMMAFTGHAAFASTVAGPGRGHGRHGMTSSIKLRDSLYQTGYEM